MVTRGGVKRIGTSVGFAALAAVMVGCAAQAGEPSTVTTEESNAVSTEEGNAKTESLSNATNGAEQVVNAAGQVVGLCSPLTCCFPTGTQWDDNTFENGLKELGCTMPAAYSPSFQSGDWWLYTKCPVTPALLELVLEYSTVAPYDAQFVINECFLLQDVGALRLDEAYVQFDPTCGSCKLPR
jgi:hypothetical protein